MAGANPSYAAKKDQRSVERRTPTCDEEASGRSMSGAKNFKTLGCQVNGCVEEATKGSAS